MKPIFESKKVFQAYAEIDFCYFMLHEYSKKYFKAKAPIIEMVDSACGYNRTKEEAKVTMGYLKQIIKCKKLIDADYSGDEKTLNEIKEQIKKLK